MKKTKLNMVLICALMMLLCIVLVSCDTGETTQTETEKITVKNEGTVVILATGGTIAGSGETGKETGYKSGTLSVESLVEAVPGIEDIANIETIQICNVNSDDITDEVWIKLANTINELAKDDKVIGFVITHGTDTLEETAYFLNLTVKTDKPVVLTGSMRPATSISADGPMNLYQSVCVAASKEAVGKGVMAVFSDKIYSARSVEKISTYDVMAINAGETGSMGIVRNNEVFFYEEPVKIHTTASEFDVGEVSELPDVNIVYFSVDANPKMVSQAAYMSKGLVIAGAGAGEFSEQFIEEINKLSIPVVISSRIDDGLITQDAVLCSNTVAANNLSPQKASILLRLSLLDAVDQDRLLDIFSKY